MNERSARKQSLAGMIDHTLLRPDAAAQDIAQLCMEAIRYGFAAVCVNGSWAPLAAEKLAGTQVKVAAVVGFPLGAGSTWAKTSEAERALLDGAAEIDMVMNIGLLKSGDEDAVADEIARVAAVCKDRAILKVILETGLLNDKEKRTACRLAQQAGANYVKTSTGFGPGGATVEDILLMREAVGPGLGVKASGGVKDRETAERLIAAGATRIGTSSGIRIIDGGTGVDPY